MLVMSHPTRLCSPATPPHTALGADMYDSVYPTRTARFGVALVPEGMLKLKNAQFASDYRWGG